MTRDPESHRIYDMKDINEPSPNGLCSVKSMHNIVDPSNKGGKMNKYNYNFIIHLLLNKYGWTQEEIGAWTWKKTNGS